MQRRCAGLGPAEVRDKAGALVAVEGMKIDRISHIAAGGRRYTIPVTAPGGRRWGHFASLSAVHIMGRAIADISRLEAPGAPKTTYNVGVAHGGTTVNAIAPGAEMPVDMRSVDIHGRADLERRVLGVVEPAANEGNGKVALDVVGDRPAGSIPATHPVVDTGKTVHRVPGLRTFTEVSSTDANAAPGAGRPGACPNITEGASEHRLDGHLEAGPFPTGVKHILPVTVAPAGKV